MEAVVEAPVAAVDSEEAAAADSAAVAFAEDRVGHIIVAHVLVTDITVVRAFLALVPVITDTEAEDALVVC